MKFSIITPSIQRESLIRCCESINSQTHTEWEHLIRIDRLDLNTSLLSKIQHPQRAIKQCLTEHNNGGNTCRHEAWHDATGDYTLYLDDDNFLAHNEALQQIHAALVDNDLPQVAFFPILRHGGLFVPVGTPRSCHVDTANLVVKREIGQWPDIPDYTSDGIFITKLVDEYPWITFHNVPPIVNMPTSGFCK